MHHIYEEYVINFCIKIHFDIFVDHNIKYIKVMQLHYIMNNKCLMHMLLYEKKLEIISKCQQVKYITIC